MIVTGESGPVTVIADIDYRPVLKAEIRIEGCRRQQTGKLPSFFGNFLLRRQLSNKQNRDEGDKQLFHSQVFFDQYIKYSKTNVQDFMLCQISNTIFFRHLT